MKFKLLLLAAILPFSSFGFEINTHQAITKCALSSECINIKEQQGAENLNYFAQAMRLQDVDYEEQKFKIYVPEKTYFDYAKSGDGLGEYEGNNDPNKVKYGKYIGFKEGKTYLKNATDKEGNIFMDSAGNPTNLLSYTDTSYISLIEADSILEDALYPHADHKADGRFNNHFYSAQFSVAARTPYIRVIDALVNPRKSVTIGVQNMLRESGTALLSYDYLDVLV